MDFQVLLGLTGPVGSFFFQLLKQLLSFKPQRLNLQRQTLQSEGWGRRSARVAFYACLLARSLPPTSSLPTEHSRSLTKLRVPLHCAPRLLDTEMVPRARLVVHHCWGSQRRPPTPLPIPGGRDLKKAMCPVTPPPTPPTPTRLQPHEGLV
jgi:hypothetical protein